MTHTLRSLVLIGALFALVACGSKSTQELIAQAEIHMAGRDYGAATIELKNALQQDVASAQARWLLGKIYLEMGDTAAAEKELRRALELGWAVDEVRPALAQALLGQGKFAEVRVLPYKDLEPEAASTVLAAQAVAALAKGDGQAAARLVKLALAKWPDSIDAMLAESRLLASEGDTIGALIVLEDILTREPSLQLAWSLKGDLLLRKQELPEALAAFDKAIDLSRKNYPDHLKRALIRLQQGDYDNAQADADYLLQIAPRQPAGNFVQGILHFSNQRYPEAISSLTLAQPAAGQFPIILFYLASAYLIEGDQDQAAMIANNFFHIAPDNVAGRKLLATIRLQEGKFAEVAELIGPVLDASPEDVGAMNLMANAQLRIGNTDQGISLLARIAELQPDSPTAQLRLGASLLISGDREDAVKHMETALDLDPEFQQADILLVLNHLQKQDFKAAIKAARAYRQRNPVSPTPQNLLGRVYLASGMQAEAKAAFEKALALDPNDTGANHNLAQLAMEEGKTGIARQHFQTILEHNPGSLPTLLQMAVLDARDQNETALVAHLEQAIAAHPTALQPRLLLARYYLGKNKPEQVAGLFATLERTQQESPQVLQLLALAQLSSDQGSDAQYTLEQLLAATPNTASSHHLMAMAKARSDDVAAVWAELLRAIELDNNYLPSLLALARLALAEQDTDDFTEYLDRVVALAPQAPDVLRLRAVAAQTEDDTATAIQFAAEAFQTAPTTQTMLELAAYHKAAGQGAEARKLVAQWAAANPDDVPSRLSLANDMQLENEIGKALALYEEILALDADNMVALNNLAWHLRRQDPPRALGYIKRASTLAPERPEVLDTLAVIEHLNGDNRRALRNVQRALVSAPDNAAMLFHRAMIEAALGDSSSAISTLERILAAGAAPFPEQAEARSLLNRLTR